MLTSRLLHRSDIHDDAWNRFADDSPQQYLYFYSWYLDAACPGWSAVVVEEGGGRWVAVLPLPLKKKWGFRYAFQPHLTQFLGIAFAPFEGERHSLHHFYKTAAAAALDALPAGLLALDLNLHPSIQYFLPFYWKKCEVLPRLTYWLPVEGGFDFLKKNFSSSVLNHLKKAGKSGLAVEEGESQEALLALARQVRIFNPAQAATFAAVWREVRQRGLGLLLHARDPQGRLASAAAFIRDGERMIFYAAAQDAAFKTSGANTLLVTEALRRCCERGGIRWFDFEGSMLEPVEQYFRSFNPEAKVYFKIRRRRFTWLWRLLGR